MKVILTKEVLSLGDPGEVVTVKDGYGRNYLVPQRMAIVATKKNVAVVAAEQKRIAGQQAREAERIKGEADGLAGFTVTIAARAGEGGKLYGSVTNMDVAEALAEAGQPIDRRRVLLESPLKRLGTYPVKVKLHPQVVVEVKVVVEPLTGEVQPEEQPAEE
jgi:large subunit ribosomal protein L9